MKPQMNTDECGYRQRFVEGQLSFLDIFTSVFICVHPWQKT